MTFGSYLKSLRESKQLRQSDLASKIGVTTVYVCDIEKGRRYPPELKKLQLWVAQLNLSSEEAAKLYDLAGDARECVPPDISEYLSTYPAAREAIRRIMEYSKDFNWDLLPLN